jgi:hypothetical protein
MTGNVVQVDFSDPVKLLQDRAVFDAIRKSRHPDCRALIDHIVVILVAINRNGRCDEPKGESAAIIRRAIKAARRGIARRRNRNAAAA